MTFDTGRFRRFLPALRILVPVAVLALTFNAIDAGAALSALRHADPGWIAAGLLLMQVQILLSAERWRFTAGRLGQVLSRTLAYREYYLTTLVNQVVPGGMAGDAVRAARNRIRDEDGRARWGISLRAIVLERLSGQIAFFAVTAGGLLAWPILVGRRAPEESADLLFGGAGTLAALAVVLVLASVFGPSRLRGFLKSFGPDMKRAFLDRGAWLVQGAVSIALVFTYVGIFAFASLAVGVAVPWVALVTVMPLALLTMLVPISVGGWGLREAAAAALWPLIGLASSAGVAAAVLYGLVSLAGALPGLFVLYATRPRGAEARPASRVESSAPDASKGDSVVSSR